ncbi:Ribosomal protein L37AE/L43A [Natranaeroarchaeum sulfidigenes]|uniref:Large ribosomal subunit protein eL43 n=2 Tax=Natranaeroarchaeum TaxID=2917705 RepID=A0A897MLV7_9EURY|nr:Ribosomal protein L37AE/L43A [Natranaeroarchaeum sulfidigenes]
METVNTRSGQSTPDTETFDTPVSAQLKGFMKSLELPIGTMAEGKRRQTGSSGRFGARYGRVARKRVSEIESDMQNATVDGDDVKRVGTGIWINEETGEKFAGGAYRPDTPAGRSVKRSIRAALSEDE